MTQRPTSGGTFLACVLLSFAFTVLVLAQSTKWKEYISDKGKFSVLLPGAPETDFRLSDPDSITGLVYLTNYYQKDGPLWSVEYFDLSAIPLDDDAVKALLERQSHKYVAWPENKMLTMNGYPALEYKMSIHRDGIEIVRIILVKQRVYRLRVFMLTQANQAASEIRRFFDSFKPAPMTDEEIAAATRATGKKAPSGTLTAASGVLQGHAVKKVQPVYPPEAKAAKVSGAAKIRVLISEEGNVIDAEVLECPDLLRESALAAARLWVFRPTELGGKPVKLQGILTLNFPPR